MDLLYINLSEPIMTGILPTQNFITFLPSFTSNTIKRPLFPSRLLPGPAILQSDLLLYL